MGLLERLFGLHRYIRTGESLTLYSVECPTGAICERVRVQGLGKYAAVLLNVGAIRRDQIRRDRNGHWFYRYEE